MSTLKPISRPLITPLHPHPLVMHRGLTVAYVTHRDAGTAEHRLPHVTPRPVAHVAGGRATHLHHGMHMPHLRTHDWGIHVGGMAGWGVLHGVLDDHRLACDWPAGLLDCIPVVEAGDVVDGVATLVFIGGSETDEVLLGVRGDLSGSASHDVRPRDAPPIAFPKFPETNQEEPAG